VITEPRLDIVVLDTSTAQQILERVLDEHHAVTLKKGPDLYGWVCRCDARPDPQSAPMCHAAAWRAARHHEVEEIISALGEAYAARTVSSGDASQAADATREAVPA
jgi:hypothetical protein